MPTVNEALLDETILHQIELQKYNNGVVRKMVAILNRTDAELFAALTAALESVTPDNFRADRLTSILASVRAMNAAAYAQIGEAMRAEMQDFTEFETGYHKMVLETNLPGQFSIASVSAEQVYAAAIATPFQGVLLSEALDGLSAGRAKRVQVAVADGFVQGKTSTQIVRELRGTRASGYQDGIFEMERRHLQAVVQTAMSHTAAFARDAVYEANDDVLDGVQWSSTLDTRTTPECRIRDRLKYTLDRKPIGHNIKWGAGPGRIHYCCRSFSVPIVKSFSELLGIPGIDESQFPKGTRASMDGQVAKDTSFHSWLERQTPARQDETLGPVRGKLLREGKLKAEAMYTKTGEYMTLAELRAKYPGAFRKAGV